MRNIGKLINSYTNSITTLCNCIEIKRKDGLILYFTDHEKDLVINEIIYNSCQSFEASAFANELGLTPNNLNIQGILSHENIRNDEILAGKYDFAEVTIFQIDYTNPSIGKIIINHGFIGEINCNNNHFSAELKSLSQKTDQVLGEIYSPMCRAKFGSNECGINTNDFSNTSKVIAVDNPYLIFSTNLKKPIGFFDYGLIEFISGDNKNIKIEIRSYFNDQIILATPLPYKILIEDEFKITIGCDKTFTTCCNTFNNAINFRGEPHVPGIDQVFKTPGTL
ncbi:MAG: DUF2163 domain-containing protein [Sphingobacteriia bacterium]|nr:DUF2163 domain-containing protein [Sphingobacteriia bacterium]